MTRVAIIGSYGKMGKQVIDICKVHPNVDYAGGLSKTREMSELAQPDVLIDFSLPTALLENLKLAKKLNLPLVIGSTGHSKLNLDLLKTYSQKIPLFYSPNFSFGIALSKKLLSLSSQFFTEPTFVDIIEKHHHHKKDSPSGTAKMLADVLSTKPTIHSIRAPNIVGEHQVIFSLEEESLEITHVAKSRAVFAKGAVEAALFLAKQTLGYYTMDNLVEDKLKHDLLKPRG